MYTWGYIKQSCLAKLDMTADQAIDMGLMNKFSFYANEAITQITSSIKPKRQYVKFVVKSRLEILTYCKQAYDLEDVSYLIDQPCDKSDLSLNQQKALDYYNKFVYVNDQIKMPNDFFSWNDEKAYILTPCKNNQASDAEYNIFGSNKIIFFKPGTYLIPYNARWVRFTPSTDDDEELDVPDDIVECLPSYIVSQCYKIDDEQKSSIYRNEYEMALARIDENDMATNKGIVTRGDW